MATKEAHDKRRLKQRTRRRVGRADDRVAGSVFGFPDPTANTALNCGLDNSFKRELYELKQKMNGSAYGNIK